MRIEIVASKGSDVNYIKTNSEVEAQIREWEFRMAGYKTKVVRGEA